MLFFDTETYSETPINCGAYRYAETCEIMIATWAVDDGPVHHVDLTLGDRRDWRMLKDLLTAHDIIVAHNAMFDRNALRLNVQCPIEVPIERWRCCMVRALAHGLPGSLDKLCGILGVEEDQAKMKDGRNLIHLFCKPRPGNSKVRRATRETHPAEWQRFIEYARADIEAMRAVWKKLPGWNYGGEGAAAQLELALWHRDQYINDRGFAIDGDLVTGAIRAVEREQKKLAARTQELTAGAVQSALKRDKLLQYIVAQHGLELDNLQGSTIERLLDADYLDGTLKALLQVRLQASSTSTAKYLTLRKATSADGRLRGTLQFNGAARTRRDAGRVFQPQNLPSRGLLEDDDIKFGIEAIKADCEDLLFDNVMLLTTSTIRGTIVPAPGRKYVVSDLSNIEGRGLAYLAGETWKLDAFRAFDAGTGPDLYKLAYAKSFRVPPNTVTKSQRAIGKVQELALGYEGGINAFVTFATAYSIDLDEMAEQAWPALPGDVVAEAESFIEWMARTNNVTYPISHRAAVTCEVFKRLWRAAHPETVAFWRDLKQGFAAAVEHPGVVYTAGRCKIKRVGAWLRILLPSGRYLCYPFPEIDKDGGLSYMGINQYNRKWCRIRTSGGKLAENVTQSFSRDLLFDHFADVEAAGYPIVLRVHDELVTEPEDREDFSAEELSAILATPPEYAPDIPLAAKGFEDYRYRKD